MTKLRIPCANVDYHKIIKTPYSVEKIGSEYEYEIMTYGYEHLIPEVLSKDLSLEPLQMLRELDRVPKGKYLFELEVNQQGLISRIKDSYFNSNILNFEYRIDESLKKIIIECIYPLKKLMKAEDPLQVGCILLDFCFTGLDLTYTKNHPYKAITVVDLKTLNTPLINTLNKLYPSHEGYLVEVPTYNLYFTTLEECALYTLETRYPNIEVAKIQGVEDKCKFSFFKFLRSLGVREHSFLHIRSCSYCAELLNPLSNSYSTFCENPFLCELKRNSLKTGWALLKDQVYIWTTNAKLKELIKSGLTTWIPHLKLKNRQESTNCSNEIWVQGALVGTITSYGEIQVIHFKSANVLVL